MAAKGLGADCPTVVAPENRNVMGAAGSRPDPPASDTKPVPCAFPAHRSLPIITGGSLLRHATRSGMQTRSARHNLRTPATITSRTLCRAGPVLGRRGLVCSPCCQADRSSSHRQGRRRPNNMSAFVSRPFNHSLNSCSNACHGCFGFPLGPPGSGRYPQIASRNCATGRPCALAVLKRDCSDARSCGSSKATYPPMT